MPIKLDLLPAEEAIKSLEAKGYKLSFDHRDVLAEEHAKNVTVAKMLRVDLLQTVQDALVQTEKQGWDLRRFSQELRPTLEKAGWWGRQEMTDPLTGEVKTVQLGSPARLQIIYDTNLRTSYSAGRWMRGERSTKTLPLLLYRTMRDTRVRPLHAAWDGTALPRSDAWWDTHYPPNGWRCRCIAYPISEADVQTLKDSGRVGIKTTALPTRTVEWTNPRTGEVRQVPLGIDPGFDYNPGKSAQAHLDGLLGEKEAAFVKSVASTPAQAEQRLLDLGAKTADAAGRADIAAAIAGDLEDLARRGIAPPDHVRVSAGAFEAWAQQMGKKADTLIAAFTFHRQTGATYLFANPASAYWQDRAGFAAAEQGRGDWSAADPAHGVRHEMGHLSHHRSAPAVYAANAPLLDEEQPIASRVSAYAAENVREFVAETFAALLAGRALDADIMRLYRKYGGVEP